MFISNFRHALFRFSRRFAHYWILTYRRGHYTFFSSRSCIKLTYTFQARAARAILTDSLSTSGSEERINSRYGNFAVRVVTPTRGIRGCEVPRKYRPLSPMLSAENTGAKQDNSVNNFAAFHIGKHILCSPAWKKYRGYKIHCAFVAHAII